MHQLLLPQGPCPPQENICPAPNIGQTPRKVHTAYPLCPWPSHQLFSQTLLPPDALGPCPLSACLPLPSCLIMCNKGPGGDGEGQPGESPPVRKGLQHGRGPVHAFPLHQDYPQMSKPATIPKCPTANRIHTLLPVLQTGIVSLQRTQFQVLALHLQAAHGDPCPLSPCLAGSRSAHHGSERPGSRSSSPTACKQSQYLTQSPNNYNLITLSYHAEPQIAPGTDQLPCRSV